METANNHDKKSRIQIGGKLRQLRQDAGMSQQKRIRVCASLADAQTGLNGRVGAGTRV